MFVDVTAPHAGPADLTEVGRPSTPAGGGMHAYGQSGRVLLRVRFTPHSRCSVSAATDGDAMSESKNGPGNPVEHYIVPSEVESRLGISPATRRRWTNRGLLRAYPIGPFYRPGPGPNREGNRNGSRVRYREADVNALAEAIKKGELARSPKPLEE
jgi:hypothetical protein